MCKKHNNKMKQETKIQNETGIISSILDLDHYKLTMGQFVYHRYADVEVTYRFQNRTSGVKLGNIIDISELDRELDVIQRLNASDEEIEYLRTLKNNGQQLFGEDYLNFLRNPNLSGYNLSEKDGNLNLEFKGSWAKAIYWETMALAVVNELYYRKIVGEDNQRIEEVGLEGRKRLEDKIQTIKQNPEIRFIEFGTRRRFSGEWQDHVVSRLSDELPNQLIGTSNVHLARKYGLKPSGTMAHELFMVMSGIMHRNDEEIRASHNQVLQEWWSEYGYDLSIALTDTYGSEFFFRDMSQEQAINWKGLRQDSGSPENFVRNQIEFYRSNDIDPKTKLFVPSDGLELDKITDLQKGFGNKINCVAGWGTNLTNDLGLKPLSLVVKAVEVNGVGTVKLSDNPAKMTGKPEDIQRFMKIFEYDPRRYTSEECIY